ncbi:transketolase [Spirochaetia bacterium]|nr:transketolase [Spirochaetia bacterium]
MRRAFLKRVDEMIKTESDTTFFTVDIGMWAIRDILRDYPDRAMNVGIYEDGMFGFAAGMAMRGLIPTIFGIQPYLIERSLEQIKMDFAYQKLGVNVVGTGAAVDYSRYGYSHYCAEDVGILKYIPGVEFIAPGTANEFIQLFNQTYRNGQPTFFRVSDHPNTKYEFEVEFGKAVVVKKGRKATVIAVSIMLDEVMRIYEQEDVTIIYYTTLEPFDKQTLADNANSGDLIIYEPQYVGSLDYDVITALEDKAIKIKHIGFPREIFRNYGTYDEKMKFYGLRK